MQIIVKTVAGKEFSFDVEPTIQVEELNRLVEQEVKVDRSIFTLTYGMKMLRKSATLEELGIGHCSTLFLLITGGMVR